MRIKRVEKFKKNRRKKLRNIILFGVILPLFSVLLGYIIKSIIIAPALAK